MTYDPQGVEREVCKDLRSATRAADELGYPVLVDGLLCEKKLVAIAAIEAGLKVGSVTVARPGPALAEE